MKIEELFLKPIIVSIDGMDNFEQKKWWRRDHLEENAW